MKRIDAAVSGAVLLFVVYLLTLAPEVTFWDAGEFIAAAHSLGIPHPPGTPLYTLLINVWAKLLFFLPFAVATNLFSAAATALAAFLTAKLVSRGATGWHAPFAAAVAAGSMSSVWLNATETEVYAASLALGMLTIAAGDRAGRAGATREGTRWSWLTAYLMALAVPLHLSALVAAPVAIAMASWSQAGVIRQRTAALLGVMLFAMGVGRMSVSMTVAGGALIVGAALWGRAQSIRDRVALGPVTLAIAALAVSALAFLIVRAAHDPAINQGDPSTWQAFTDLVARRQYDVAPLWPRKAPLWVQFGNLFQYADWQAALSLGPTVLPSMLRTLFTMLFVALGIRGAQAQWRSDRRGFVAVALLMACGALGVLVYLNLHAGPSVAFLPPTVPREARERDYFYVFGFWAWGIWAGLGAISYARRYGRPAWVGVLVACLPIALNWRAVTRAVHPETALPLTLARAFLESTPPTAVLFVMGDNDSYPLWYAQEVKGVRPDVTVITVPLLPTQWYRSQIASRYQLLDSAQARRYDGKLEVAARIAAGARRLGRPVALSMTMKPAERKQFGDSWTARGLVYVAGREAVDAPASRAIAAMVDSAVGNRPTRPAIDPVNVYYRRMLACPEQLTATSPLSDSTRLDSACNYR